MYYDRTLPEGYFGLLREHPFFRRLLALVRSTWGADVLAHAEFRRSNDPEYKHGAVKLYVGRSAPLEVIATGSSTFCLSAHAKYAPTAPDLFDRRFSPTALDGIAAPVEEYLRAVCSTVGKQFTEGEGRVHGGFVRRHGLDHRDTDSFLAVDKEVVVGFASRPAKLAFHEELRLRFGKPHRELDSIGVLADGNIAVVELKKERESVKVAADQAATHVLTFQRLVAEHRDKDPGFHLGATINKLIEQKVAVGLLPEHAFKAKKDATVVPVIAAPDGRPGWETAWRSGLHGAMEKHGDLLGGLRLWKLSGDGVIEADVTA